MWAETVTGHRCLRSTFLVVDAPFTFSFSKDWLLTANYRVPVILTHTDQSTKVKFILTCERCNLL